MKKVIALIALCSVLFSVYAESNYSDQIMDKSNEAKRAGVVMLVSGIIMIGGGVAMISSYDRGPNDTRMEAGLAAAGMGGFLALGGVTLDVFAIRKLRESKTILKEAQEREGVPISLHISPQSVAFTVSF